VLLKLTPFAGHHCLDYDHIVLFGNRCELHPNLPKGLSNLVLTDIPIENESFPKFGSFSVTQTSFVQYNMVDGQNYGHGQSSCSENKACLFIFHHLSNISIACPSILYGSNVALPFSSYRVFCSLLTKPWHSYVPTCFLAIKNIASLLLLSVLNKVCFLPSTFNKFCNGGE
jgi:hypothetical protein